jgi:hypothetical protein
MGGYPSSTKKKTKGRLLLTFIINIGGNYHFIHVIFSFKFTRYECPTGHRFFLEAPKDINAVLAGGGGGGGGILNLGNAGVDVLPKPSPNKSRSRSSRNRYSLFFFSYFYKYNGGIDDFYLYIFLNIFIYFYYFEDTNT